MRLPLNEEAADFCTFEGLTVQGINLCNKYQYNNASINLIICSLAFFQEIVPNSALRLYFAYIPHEMHEDLLSRQR